MANKTEISGSFILAPVPVVLVACRHERLGRNVLTVAWCGVACSDPETIAVSIRPERHSYRMIAESGGFTVNIPTVAMVEEVDCCGQVSGAQGDKFERAGLTAADAKIVPAPLVAECPVNIECSLGKIVPAGVHHIFLGRVVAKHADGAALKDGRLDFSKIPLLAYVNGEYWSLGGPVGRFGLSGSK